MKVTRTKGIFVTLDKPFSTYNASDVWAPYKRTKLSGHDFLDFNRSKKGYTYNIL